MELFIQVKDGQAFQHPIFGDNFCAAFPEVDVDNLPPEFARFVRVPRPTLGAYEVWIFEEPTYELVDGVYTDVWHKRDMTDQEKAEKQQSVKDAWAARGWISWVFNEGTCAFDPPVPKPDDGKIYKWDEQSVSWVVVEEQIQAPIAQSAEEIATPVAQEVVTLTPEEVVTFNNGADSITGGV